MVDGGREFGVTDLGLWGWGGCRGNLVSLTEHRQSKCHLRIKYPDIPPGGINTPLDQ